MAVGGFLIRGLYKQETRWARLVSGFFVGCEGLIAGKPGSYSLIVLSCHASTHCGSWLACDGAGAGASELSDKPFRLSLGTGTTNLRQSLPIQRPGLQARRNLTS